MLADAQVKFGAYEFNLVTGELRNGQTVLKLAPQSAKVLATLITHAGELVTREMLQRELWGGRTSVDFDGGLNFCIRRIRAVLCEDAEQPRYIETIPRRGYRFICPVTSTQAPVEPAGTPRRRAPFFLVAASAGAASVVMFFWLAIRVDSPAVSGEAFSAYRKGRFLSEELRGDQRESIEYYQSAIAHDGGFAPAYAGLANAYVQRLLLNPAAGAQEYLTSAESMARKSLQTDPKLPAGHIALGSVLTLEWQWRRAEQEFQKAIELNPKNPEAHSEYSLLLSSLGRHEEALHQAKLAVDLDPVSAQVRFNLAHDLWMAREYDAAILESRRVLELHPETRVAYNVIGHCYAKKGMYQEAQAAFRESQPKRKPSASPQLAYVLALSGQRQEAEAIVAELKKSGARLPAHCYAALEENGKALEVLERDLTAHDAALVWVNRPEYEQLRAEPRFAAILQKMGLIL